MDTRDDRPVTPGTRSGLGRGRLPLALTIAALVAAMFLSRPTLAAPPPPADDFWTFPEGCAAFFAFDPRPLGPGIDKDSTRALAEAGLRGLLNSVATIDGGGPPVPAGILTPGVLGSSPYRVCLLEIAGVPREVPPSPDRPFRLEKLAAILEIRAPADRHDEIIGAIRGALDRESASRRAAPGTETPLALPGGRRGTSFTRSGEPEWREVSWSSSSSGVLIGLGHGSIERWLAAAAPRANALPEWSAHRSDISRRRGPSNPVLEAMIDASVLRRSMPEEFAFGRLGRLADAWHIPNAREVMLHIRLPRPPVVKPGEATPPPTSAPLLLVDLSYSSRADKPPTCRSIPISLGAWPADVPPTPAAAPYAIVLRSDWIHWVGLSLDTWVACSPKAGLEANAARARWMRPHADALERAAERSGPNVVISGPAPGVPTVAIPLKAAQPTERTVADLREMFAPFTATIRLEGAQKTWTLRLAPEDVDPDKLLAEFSWAVAKDGTAVRAAWEDAALVPAKPAK